MFPSASAGRCSSHAKSTSVRPPAAGQRGANSTAPASSLLRSSAEWSASREVVVGKFKIHGLSADLGFRLPSFPTFPHEHPLSCFFWLRRKTTIQPVPGRTAPLDEEPVDEEEEEEDRAQEQRPFRNRPDTGTTRRPNRILPTIAEWISSPAKERVAVEAVMKWNFAQKRSDFRDDLMVRSSFETLGIQTEPPPPGPS